MGKRSRSRTKEKRGSKRRSLGDDVASEDIDDEIDACELSPSLEYLLIGAVCFLFV